MESGPTRTHIHEMEWFIEKPPFDLKGELEPWYFIFKKKWVSNLQFLHQEAANC